jgi:putative FmdB family regulatory protein
MPIYEYRCAACGHELEALQKLADAQLKDCPSCGQSQLRKLVSVAGFRLKGSGWYATDFKNRSQPAAKSNGESDKSEPAAPAPEGASAKPAVTQAKADSKGAAPATEGASAKPAVTQAKADSKPATGGDTCP